MAAKECNNRTMTHCASGPSLPFPSDACIDSKGWQHDCLEMISALKLLSMLLTLPKFMSKIAELEELVHQPTDMQNKYQKIMRSNCLYHSLYKFVECGVIHLEKPDTCNNPVLYFDDEMDLCIWTPDGQFKPKLLSLGSMGWGIFLVDKDYAYQRESLEALLKGCSLKQFQRSDGKLYDF